MTSTTKLEKEIKARLLMIPSAFDRRKFRGLIQRIRTADRKANDKKIVERIKEYMSKEDGVSVESYSTMIKALDNLLQGKEKYENKTN